MTKRFPEWITQYDDFPNYKDSHAWRLEKALRIAWKTLNSIGKNKGSMQIGCDLACDFKANKAMSRIEMLGKQ